MAENQENGKNGPIKENWKPKASETSFWVFVVAVMALIPLLLNVSQNLLRGDDINTVISKYFPDFLIVTFSLSISIFYDIVRPCHHKWVLAISVVSMIICIAFYYILNSIESIKSNYLKIVIIGSCVLYIINLLLRGTLKWRTMGSKQQTDEGAT